jgi:hypothetical protein
MRKIVFVLIMTATAVMMIHVSSKAPLAQGVAGQQYEVVSPWAEADPKPVRGISPRVDTLAGKKVGLFANFKRAAVPIAQAIEKRLKAQYPDIQTNLFHSTEPNVDESVTANKAKFAAWAKEMDAVIAVVGD